MIRQGLALDGILDRKFKILRTSIMLGNLNNRDDIFREYEETSREIDKIRNGVYEELLASKMYTTVTLEEERDRLEDLINFIKKRVNEKNDFVDDYIKITSNFLDDLSIVNGERDIVDYEIRLGNINEFLENSKNIKLLNAKLIDLRDQLEDKYVNKANNELINTKLEDELIEDFNRICLRDEYYSSLNYSDIDSELYKLESSILEKETVMNTFISSYQALVNAGISGAEREEYASYVKDARIDYYNDIEKKCILDLYKLVLDKEQDYDRLYLKREKINNILVDRAKVRRNLDINSRDNIEEFVKLSDEQFNIIKSQKYNLEAIDELILQISECENKLNELELANKREEIQKLIDEYSVDEVKAEKIEMPEEKDIVTYEKVVNQEEDGVVHPSNMVIKIKEPVKINVKSASDTAKLVMKKVVIVLEPKKFNAKRDKLKEAEEELNLGINNEEKVVSVVKGGKNSSVGLELDTKAVFDQDKVREVNDLGEIKINTEDPDNIKLPTEIFIEEPKEEKVDLFKVTDPFLDDNNFEKENKKEEELNGGMPKILNIGTVKPNSAFAKIQDAVKENDSIILPTLGLADNKKVDVPIVSENYIS